MDETQDHGPNIPQALFEQVAKAVIPGLKASMKLLLEGSALTIEDTSPTIGVTAAIMIEGHMERVRVAVTLNPDDDDEDEEEDEEPDAHGFNEEEDF